MRLLLQDFGCWEKKEVQFEDNGLNLLLGPSGRGKTTLLRAILFVLFGTGRKVVREGATKCRVELEFGDICIVRATNPRTLHVTVGHKTYEATEAQAYIEQTLCLNPARMYLEQNARDALISATPQGKLEFLEQISSRNITLTTIKDRIREEMSILRTELTEHVTRIEVVERQLAIPIPALELPEEWTHPHRRDVERWIRHSTSDAWDRHAANDKVQGLLNAYATERQSLIQQQQETERLLQDLGHRFQQVNAAWEQWQRMNANVERFQQDRDRAETTLLAYAQTHSPTMTLPQARDALQTQHATLKQEEHAYSSNIQILRDAEMLQEKAEGLVRSRNGLQREWTVVHESIQEIQSRMDALQYDPSEYTLWKQRFEQRQTYVQHKEAYQLANEVALEWEEYCKRRDAMPMTQKSAREHLRALRQYMEACDVCASMEQELASMVLVPGKLQALQARELELTHLREQQPCPACSIPLHIVDGRIVCVETSCVEAMDVDRIAEELQKIRKQQRIVQEQESHHNLLVYRLEEAKRVCDEYVQRNVSHSMSLEELEECIELWNTLETQRGLLDMKRRRHPPMPKPNAPHPFSLDEIQGHLERLHRMKTEWDTLQKTIQPLRIKYEDLERRIEAIHIPIDVPTMDEIESKRAQLRILADRVDQLRQSCMHKQHHVEEWERLQKTYDRANEAFHIASTERNSYVSPVYERETLEQQIQTEHVQMDGLRQRLQTISHDHLQWERVHVWLTQHCERQGLIDLQRSAQKGQNEVERNLQSCEEFVRLATEAEALALKTTIDTLNVVAQTYLDAFFPNATMSAELYFRTKSNEKREPDLRIQYHTRPNVDVHALSGGEYDRVVLAFALAVMQYCNSPIHLLDECVKSLDAETATIVCQHLRTHSKDRCVILIAHQLIEGDFDHVVTLTE